MWRDARHDVVLLLTGDGLGYLDDDGGWWQVAVDDGCCRGAQVDERTVLVALDDGRMVGLDRATGQVRGEIDPPLPGAPTGARADVDHAFAGGYRFLLTSRAPIVVHGVHIGAEVARLPGSCVPLVAGALVVTAVDGEVVALRGPGVSELLAAPG